MTEILKIQMSPKLKAIVEKRAIDRGIRSTTWGPIPEHIRRLIKADLDYVARIGEHKIKKSVNEPVQVSLANHGAVIDREDLNRRADQLGLLGAPEYVRFLVLLDLMMAGHGVHTVVCPKCNGEKFWPKLKDILGSRGKRKPCGRCSATGKVTNDNPLGNLQDRIRSD